MPEKLRAGKRGRHLRHLRHRQRQDRRPAEAAVGHLALDVDLELERLRVDRRQRRERVGRRDRVGAGLERRFRFFRDVGGRRRELDPDRLARDFLHRAARPCRSAGRSCRCWIPCPRDPCADTRGSARSASTPCSWQATTSSRQWFTSLSSSEPAMIEATSTLCGNASLIRSAAAATSQPACRRSAPSSTRNGARCWAASPSTCGSCRVTCAGTWSSAP